MEGDQRIAIFPRALIKKHQSKKCIMRIIGVDGIQTNSLAIVKDRAIRYFQDIYSCEPHEMSLPNLNLRFDNAISLEVAAWMRRFLRMDEI